MLGAEFQRVSALAFLEPRDEHGVDLVLEGHHHGTRWVRERGAAAEQAALATFARQSALAWQDDVLERLPADRLPTRQELLRALGVTADLPAWTIASRRTFARR